jgi:hypothetical protein
VLGWAAGKVDRHHRQMLRLDCEVMGVQAPGTTIEEFVGDLLVLIGESTEEFGPIRPVEQQHDLSAQ